MTPFTPVPNTREGSPPFGAPVAAAIDTEVELLLTGVPAEQAERLRDLIRLSVQRAWRMQRLQSASGALSRTLNSAEVVQELTRGAHRILGGDGVFVARPDLDRGLVTVLHRLDAMSDAPVVGQAPIPLDSGAVAQAARTGEVVSTSAPSECDRAVAGEPVIEGMLVAPLMHGRRLLGVVGVWVRERAEETGGAADGDGEAFGTDDVESLRLIAAQAAVALSNAQLYAESERERRQSEALAAVARAVGESLRMGEVLRLILRHATALLGADGGGVALLDGDYLNIVAAVGSGELLKGVHLPVTGSVAGRVVREGTTIIVNDAANDPSVYHVSRRLANIEKVINVPLTTARGPLGVLSIFNRAEDFRDEDARVLRRLADQVTVAIVNARLYEELSDATREWSATFDAIGSAMVIVDEGGRIARYNTRALQLANIDGPRELVGRPFYETFLGHAPAADDDLPIERAMRDGVTVRGVMPAPARGTALRVSAAPHANGGAIVTLEEERTAPYVLDRNARVLEAASDALLTLGPTGEIGSANPAARALFGRANLEGVALRDLLPESERPVLERELQQTLVGASQRGEHRLDLMNGEHRIVEASFAPLSLAGGIEGVVVWMRDVTEERSRAEALQRSEARYAQLVETAPDAIVTLDEQGRLTALNKTFEVATGVTRDRALSANMLEFVDPRDRDLVSAMFRATLHGTVQRGEIRFLHREGGTGWASIVASPLYNAGVPSGALAIVRNITQEKRVMEQMMRHERMAAVGHLVSGLSHELNNPLASVMALGELLVESTALPPEEHENAQLIVDETRRAAKIIGNLLAFARQQPSLKSPIDVNVLVAQSVDMRRYALQLDNVAIDVGLAPNLPAVLADAAQLQQVLLNLLSNAEQALSAWSGPRRLSVRTELSGETVTVTVEDTGPGIKSEDRERIFDPFFTTRGVGKGTGMGLSVAEGIVRDHGGRIHVESSFGAGASLIVELPVARPGSGSADASREWTSPEQPLAVLVVDDEAGLREALTRFLTKLGHSVDTAVDGFEARERLASRTYDRILLDVRMPGLAGDVLYRELAERAPEMASRVIILTGDSENSALQAFVTGTGRTCIRKPFTLDDVRRALAETGERT